MSASPSDRTQSKPGLLDRLSIKAKVVLAISSVILVVIAVGGVSYTSFVHVSHDVDLYAYDVEVATEAAKVEVEFLRMRLHAREFALTGREDHADAVREIEPMLRRHIQELLVLVESQPQARAWVTEIQEAFEGYIEDFHRTEAIQAELHTLFEDNLRPNGDRMVVDLDAILEAARAENNSDAMILASTAREHALLAQVYTLMLITDHSDTYGDLARREFGLMEATLDGLEATLRTEEERTLFADLTASQTAYKNGFERYHADIVALDALIDGHMIEVAETLTLDAELLQAAMADHERETEADMRSVIWLAEMEIIAISLAGTALGIGVAWLVGGGLARPISAMTHAMRLIAAGDTSTIIPSRGRGDEIGTMAETVHVFKENLIQNVELASRAAEERRVREIRVTKLTELTGAFDRNVETMLQGMVSASAQLKSTASDLSESAEESSHKATEVAASSEEAAKSFQSVAGAAEELDSAIQDISRQVVQQTSIAEKAVAAIDRSDRQVQNLSEEARKIGEVVNLITSIAEQTNLLALNATIEAARAGEAGKGFAVVASEVKNLANQTAKATEQIAGQISAIQGSTGQTVETIQEVGSRIKEMQEISTSVAAAVEQQNAATRDISGHVRQAVQGSHEVSVSITGVSHVAHRTGTTAHELDEASAHLSTQADTLKGFVHKFLEDVQAV